jgi:hypothetical protein
MRHTPTQTGILLWTAQALLAALFLFAGGMKLIIPMDVLAAQAHMPGLFLRFIASAEVLGAVGLILPAWLRIQPALTPAAAVGLVVIMAGAVVTSVVTLGPAAAIVPLITGVVAAFVAYGRWRLAPISARA